MEEIDGVVDPFPEETALEAQETVAAPVRTERINDQADIPRGAIFVEDPTERAEAKPDQKSAIAQAAELAAARAEAKSAREREARLMTLTEQALQSRTVVQAPAPVVEETSELAGDEYGQKVQKEIDRRVRKAMAPIEAALPRMAEQAEQTRFMAEYGSKISPDLQASAEKVYQAAVGEGLRISRKTALKIALGEAGLANLGKTVAEKPETAQRRTAARESGGGTPARDTARAGARMVDVDTLPRDRRIAALEKEIGDIVF